ncbi:MAG: hypothetical protein GY795_24845 [Desulfobacterales bacterium]|nr:hypothetical protein [Desulfobacterales bacterium]
MKKKIIFLVTILVSLSVTGSAFAYSYYLPYFIADENHWTGLGIKNSENNLDGGFTAIVHDQNGNVISRESHDIPPGGQKAVMIDGKGEGWIWISATYPLTGLSFFGTNGPDNYMADIPLVTDVSTTLHIPHVAQNDQWDTTVMICNPNYRSTTVYLTFVDDQGNRISSKKDIISHLGSRKYDVSVLTRDTLHINGSIEISADQGVAAFAVYSNLKSGGMSYAGINAVSPFPVNHATVEKNGIKYILQTDKTVYKSGDNVEIMYGVGSKSYDVITLGRVPSCSGYNLRIIQEDREIWKKFRILPSCPDSMANISFSRPRIWKKNAVWNMANDSGTAESHDDFTVPPGIYDITGELMLSEDKWIPVSLSVEIEPSESYPNSTATVEEDGLEYYLQTDKAVYDYGDNVKILYGVINKRDGNRVLETLSDCMRYNLYITSQAGETWVKYRTPPADCPGLPEYSLYPRGGEWKNYTDWNMKNDNGTAETYDDFPVSPGIYTVTGELRPSEDKRVTLSLSFQIKEPDPYPNSVVEKDGIEYYIQTDRSVYSMTDNVKILYRVKNKTDDTRTFGTVSVCDTYKTEFFIRKDSSDIWRSCWYIPPCGLTEFSLRPGEIWELERDWNMKNDNATYDPDDDSSVTSGGTYTVTGELRLSGDAAGRVPVSVSFEVR